MKIKSSLLFILLFLLLFSCRVKKDVQLEKINSSYSFKVDSLVTDSSIEYTEIERVYIYPDSARVTHGEAMLKGAVITEKIKNFKKSGSITKVEKVGEGKSEVKTKISHKEKAPNYSTPIFFIILTAVVIFFLVLRMRK